MKKLKFFFAACAAMVSLGANAQLTDGTVYWIQDTVTGQFISQGDDWSTKAVGQDVGGLGFQAVLVSDNVYKLYNIMWNTVNDDTRGLGPDLYVDQTPAEWTLTASGDGYLISSGDNYLVNNGTENAYKEKPINKTTDAAAATVWKFLTKTEYDAAIQEYKDGKAASYATKLGYTVSTVSDLEALINNKDNFISKDYTTSIINPTLGSNGDGWTHGQISQRNEGWAVGSGCAEFWTGCGFCTQTVASGLPNGLYKVTFVGSFRPANYEPSEDLASEKASSPAFVYANDAKVEFLHWIDVPAKANGRSGITVANGYQNTFYTYLTDGSLALGVVADGFTDKNNWTTFGQFTLTYYSDQVSDEEATEILETANGIKDSKMGSGVKSALTSAISAFENNKTIANFNALNTAISNANASIASYAALLTAITNANDHTIYTPVFDASTTTYTNAVSTAQGVYDAGEVEDCTDAITALTYGIYSAYESDYLVFANDYAYDYSTLLNQDMTKWASTDYVTMTANEHWNGKTGQRYYEQSGAEWSSNAWNHAASETTTLPAGKYVMSITARASADVTSTMSVKVGDSEAVTVALPHKGNEGRGITTSGVGSYADDGIYANTNGRGWEYRFIAFEVTENDTPVTISFSSSTNVIYNWVSLAAPLLKGDVHPNQIKLNQVKSLAETLAEYESQISAATFATFADHLTAANNATVENTDLDEIITNLQADIEIAKAEVTAIAAARASFQTLKEYADALVAVANDNGEANTTLATAISDQISAADVNDAEAITTATSTLKAAMITYVGAANPVGEDAQFDCTFMLTNPDLTGLKDWAPADGWAGENSGNSQVMYNTDVQGADEKPWFYEFWSYNPYTSKFNLYLTTTLPEGTYNMECYAFAQCASNTSTRDEEPAPQGISFSVNDTDGSFITSTVMEPASLEFVNDAEQEVKIGLKAQTGNNRTWMGIGYVQLFKVPAKAFTLDENTAWDNTKSGAGDVILNRNIKEGINTLTLPFSMTQAEVEDNFGAGSVVYALKAYDADLQLISFTTHEGIVPNVPCLLKATDDGNTYLLEGRTIVAGEPEAKGTDVTMIGTYAASIKVPTGSYIIHDDQIYYVNSDVSLKNTRAYIKLKPENPGDEFYEGRTLILSFDDGETTGIATMEDGQLNIETGDIYDLSGRKVKNPAKGIYMMNGKKVIK